MLRISTTGKYQSNSSTHHYECVALCKDTSLQRGRFCTRSLASCIPRTSEDRSSWMFFIHVVCGCPNGRLQFSGGGSKMAWLASAFSSNRARCPKKVRRRDLITDESGGWLVMQRMLAFLTKSCLRMSRILRRDHWSTASVCCISALLTAQASMDMFKYDIKRAASHCGICVQPNAWVLELTHSKQHLNLR